MKNNFFPLSMLAISLIAGGCSKDFDESQASGANNGGQAISFKPWANKQTKAPTQAADMTDFAVLATDPTSQSGLQVLIDGALVTGSNAAGWSYSPVAYWPETATVNFYAFSPTAAAGVTNDAAALVGQDDSNAGEPVIEYELPTELGEQEDLLVARHSGTYVQDGANGVLLNFRHALSRIKFQAKSESRMDFEVLGIKLFNLKNQATLDLKKVPKDATAFPYPTNNATIASSGYQTLWEMKANSTVINLEANLTTKDVLGDGNWHDIVGDDDAIYVIPQENEASDLTKSTILPGGPDSGSSNKFYIEITYVENDPSLSPAPTPITYAVPVPAIVGDAYASSIAFEMERQYTFQFELSGKKPIQFQGVTVSDYDEVIQDEPLRLTWAGSNIYYDAALKHLTFADDSDKSKEQYQGVLFKWGSLTGISPEGAYAAGKTVTYPKGGAAVTATSPSYAAIPYVNTDPGVYGRDVKYLTTAAHDTINGKGDICKYLTQRGWAPKGKRWRMPTADDFGKIIDYAQFGTYASITGQTADGTTAIPWGWKRGDLNQPYFPASGYRDGAGNIDQVGWGGGYWASSASGATTGFFMNYNTTNLVIYNNPRGNNFPIRCIVE